MHFADFVARRVTHETNNHMTRILAGHPGTEPDRATREIILRENRLDQALYETVERSLDGG